MGRFDLPRFAPRLAAVAIGATAPLVAVILWLILTCINSAITKAEWEIKGNAFQRPLEHLLDAIPRRLIAIQSHGPGIGAIDAEIDQAFVDLDQAADLDGADLQFTSAGLEARGCSQLRVPLLRERWRAVTAAAPDSGGYDRIVSDIAAMIDYAGNASNLSLDPDLDSSSLIDVSLRALPQMELRLGTILRQTLEGQNGNFSPAESLSQRAVQRAMLQIEGLDRIDRDLRTMLVEDEAFYGVHLPLHLEVAEEWKHVVVSVQAFLALQGSVAPVSVEEVTRKGTAARSACYTFWKMSSAQVAELLVIRIEAYRTRRAQSLIVTGALVGLAGVIGWKFGRAIDQELLEKLRAASEAFDRAPPGGTVWPSPGNDRVGAETSPPLGGE